MQTRTRPNLVLLALALTFSSGATQATGAPDEPAPSTESAQLTQAPTGAVSSTTPTGPEAGAEEPAAAEPVVHVQRGKATYYGGKFHGRRTASGERFDKNAMVAAHPSLPFGTVVRVTNVKNGRSTKVRIVDRGPAKRVQRRGIIIDLSHGAARQLGFVAQGRTPVRLDVLAPEPTSGGALAREGRESPG